MHKAGSQTMVNGSNQNGDTQLENESYQNGDMEALKEAEQPNIVTWDDIFQDPDGA